MAGYDGAVRHNVLCWLPALRNGRADALVDAAADAKL
jgi:hypothetical protein